MPSRDTLDLIGLAYTTILICFVSVAIWFYVYQNEAKSYRISLRAMLMLVLALAVALRVGFWVCTLSPAR